MTVLPLVIAVVLFALGFIGTIVPMMPGVVLIWAGMLVYGLMTGFETLTLTFFILQGLAVVLVLVIDYIATAVGTRRFGGSRAAMVGAAVGLLLGLILAGPAGIIFGPFLGAFLVELLKGVSGQKALRSSFGALIGVVGGIFLKLFIEVFMVIWFFKNIWA